MSKEYNCHECGEVQPPPSPGDYPICDDCLNEGPVTRFDRFDIVEAHYAFYEEHHSGQASDFYRRLCHIGTYFKPSPMWKGFESLTNNAKAIYFDLCNKHDVAPF
mgnify:CR=1 FL=1